MTSGAKCACLVLGMCKAALSHVGVLEARVANLRAQHSPAAGYAMAADEDKLVTSVLEAALNAISLVWLSAAGCCA